MSRARNLADYVSTGVTSAELDQLDTTSGTPGSGNFLRGDKTWDAPAGGITETDQWKLTTTFPGTVTPIASALVRSNSPGFGLLGTGMTESSGIFTFPSTGYWKVGYTMGFQYNGDSKYNGGDIQVTINDSSYAAAASNWAFIQQTASGTTYAAAYMETIVDVTSVSTVKVRFTTSVQNSSAETLGNSSYTITGMQFIRLGDT